LKLSFDDYSIVHLSQCHYQTQQDPSTILRNELHMPPSRTRQNKHQNLARQSTTTPDTRSLVFCSAPETRRHDVLSGQFDNNSLSETTRQFGGQEDGSIDELV